MMSCIGLKRWAEEVGCNRKKKKKHPGRNVFPGNLCEEEIIKTQEDNTDVVGIGEEICETIENTPASLFYEHGFPYRIRRTEEEKRSSSASGNNERK